METRAISFCCAAIAGLWALGTKFAAGGGELFEPMKQSCARERADYCNAVMPSDTRLALCLYAHEDKLSAPCAVSVYDGMVALHISLNKLSAYAKTCRSDLLKLCASTKWGSSSSVS